MNLRGLASAIADGDLDQHIVCVGFGILNEDIEISIFIKDSRIEEFKFCFPFPAAVVLVNQLTIRIRNLRIFVEHLQVRMRGRHVEVVIQFLDVFPVISFGARKTKEALSLRIGSTPFHIASEKQRIC